MARNKQVVIDEIYRELNSVIPGEDDFARAEVHVLCAALKSRRTTGESMEIVLEIVRFLRKHARPGTGRTGQPLPQAGE